MTRTGIAFLMILVGGCGAQQMSLEMEASFVEAPIPTAYEILTVDYSTPVVVFATTVEVGLPPVPTPPLVATVEVPPVRLPAEQATDTLPPPTTTTAPQLAVLPSTGGCAQWAGILLSRGASADDVVFFVDGGILKRESGCGLDMLNDSSGDSGPCQIAPIHNQAGYFGGKYFGDGGWLGVLHGRRVRQDLHNPQWVDACITLRNVCGNGPWRLGDYGCANRRIFG